MFKDYTKYLSTTIKVYLFVLFIIFIMKLIGLDYFGLSIGNPILIELEKYLSNPYLRDFFYMTQIVLTQYLMISMICKNNSKRIKVVIILLSPLTYGVQLLKDLIDNYNILSILFEMSYLFLLSVIINHFNKEKLSIKKLIKRFFIVVIINILFQLVSAMTRYNYDIKYINNFIANVILNLDYIFLLLITQNLVFKEGVVEECMYLVEVGSSLLKKISLKKSLKRLQKRFLSNYKKFKKKSKEEKLTIIIYVTLSLIWNSLSLALVLFVAFLNDTLIECIFILTAFWLSKRSFGKPFHFDSMKKCFIVSNLSYYFLNHVTTHLGISILVPILLGVGLSYVTSKFVKKTYKPLYRGMPVELFEETISKIIDKDSIKYKICYDFYINKESDLSLSFKYNYSVSGIRKIKDRINEKIKKLN